jgi:hypothetical protein
MSDYLKANNALVQQTATVISVETTIAQYWALAVALEVSPDQSNDRGAFPATCHRDRLVPPCAWDDGVVGLLQADSNSTTLMSGSFIV